MEQKGAQKCQQMKEFGFSRAIVYKALEARQNGDNNRAIELFQNILRIGKASWPHLELAHIYLGLNQLKHTSLWTSHWISREWRTMDWNPHEDEVLSLNTW